MRALVLTAIITVMGGGLVALAACGDTETTAGPTDSGSESSSGSSGTSGDDVRPDTNSSSSGNPTACNNLMQLGQTVSAQGVAGARPTGVGGPLTDGTYVLVKGNAYGLAGASQNIGATTLQRMGTTAQTVTTNPQMPMQIDSHTGTITTNANNFTLSPTCTTAGDAGALSFQGTYSYGKDASVDADILTIYFDFNTGSILGTVPASAEFKKQ